MAQFGDGFFLGAVVVVQEYSEIAGMVSYLAGTEAAFVTGASFTIDGGYNA